MPNETGIQSRLENLRVRCWPYQIEFVMPPDHLAYEVRVSLETRDPNSGEPTTMFLREMIDYDVLVSNSFPEVIEYVVRDALHKLAIEHVDAHLKFG